MPFVAATQLITSLAFVFDGLHYGASDFAFTARATIGLVLPVLGVLLVAPAFLGLGGVWMGLTLLMFLRMFVGFGRIGTKSGPWAILIENTHTQKDAELNLIGTVSVQDQPVSHRGQDPVL
eukprot:TRINITY_DN4647_c0_g1_i1.p1 TRINITY_DN4647_c0_g1~~TRINITY_DN4647_c0_g1_i1.p1  ORF type:complete len:133 (+),score=29.09 TRINITY_DN4647_c0_g1_i1:37-399(+)